MLRRRAFVVLPNPLIPYRNTPPMTASTPTLSLPLLEADPFADRLGEPLRAAAKITTLQFNLGLRCNLACRHCHVESSPTRTDPMDNAGGDTIDRVLDWLDQHERIETVDLTGGSPEMNPHFRRLVEALRDRDGRRDSPRRIMVRHNPTITTHVDRGSGERFDWIPDFFAEHRLEVVASLPCYLEDNVERQRGKGAYNASIEGLRRLNDAGYGRGDRLRLNLVYNPVGASLPPPQTALAGDYHRELRERFGLVFQELWTITNMPIKRFRHDLEREGKLDAYMGKLADAFNPDTVEPLMCRHQVHIDSQGRVYDCDFNYGVEMPNPAFEDRRLWEIPLDELEGRLIATADHCYGCTAGAGSSCGGALA